MHRLLLGALLVALCGCITRPSSDQDPSWAAGKRSDSVWAYYVGAATGWPSPETAQAAAYQNALASICKEVWSAVTVQGASSGLLSSFPIQGAEIMPGCVSIRETHGGYGCKLLVSFAQLERKRLIDRIAFGAKLNAMWAEAMASYNRRDYNAAIALMKSILPDYAKGLCVAFELDALKVRLGDAYFERRDFLEARAVYENLLKGSGSKEWQREAWAGIRRLPDAPRLWTMRDRWGGQSVSLLCMRRKNGNLEKFSDLSDVLIQDCREAKIVQADLASDIDSPNAGALFETLDFSKIAASARERGSGVTLAVLLEDDVVRMDAKVRGTMEATDSDALVRVLVVRTSDGVGLYSVRFPLITWQKTDSTVAQLAATILIRDLVSNCPAIDLPAE